VKCLVIQTAYLGDVILTLPLLALLREHSDIRTLVALTTPIGARFLRGQDVSDRTIVYDKMGGDRGASGFRRIVDDVRRCGFDAAVIPHRSFRSALLPLLALIPDRVGFDESGGRVLLTRRLPYRSRPHEAERLATLAGPLGVSVPSGRVAFRVRTTAAGENELSNALENEGVDRCEDLVVAAPGSRWTTKRWEARRFGEALATLGAELGARPVVTGTPDEAESGAAAATAAGPGAVDLTGALSVAGLTALAKRSVLLLSNDSAAAHIAAGVGTPVVAVFGPTTPAQGFAPYSPRSRVVDVPLGCRPCGRHGSDRCRRGTHGCMKQVGVADVVAAALEVLGEP